MDQQPAVQLAPPAVQAASRPYQESLWQRFKRFLNECNRVLKVTQKPNKAEFLTTVKVSAIGLAIIGMIGFILSMIQQLLLR